MNGEIISESELKNRIESIPQFIFEQKNEHINTAKLSLNIWLIINSGTASAIIVKGIFSGVAMFFSYTWNDMFFFRIFINICLLS